MHGIIATYREIDTRRLLMIMALIFGGMVSGGILARLSYAASIFPNTPNSPLHIAIGSFLAILAVGFLILLILYIDGRRNPSVCRDNDPEMFKGLTLIILLCSITASFGGLLAGIIANL